MWTDLILHIWSKNQPQFLKDKISMFTIIVDLIFFYLTEVPQIIFELLRVSHCTLTLRNPKSFLLLAENSEITSWYLFTCMGSILVFTGWTSQILLSTSSDWSFGRSANDLSTSEVWGLTKALYSSDPAKWTMFSTCLRNLSKKNLLSSINIYSILFTGFLGGIGGTKNPGHLWVSEVLSSRNSLYLLLMSISPNPSDP